MFTRGVKVTFLVETWWLLISYVLVIVLDFDLFKLGWSFEEGELTKNRPDSRFWSALNRMCGRGDRMCGRHWRTCSEQACMCRKKGRVSLHFEIIALAGVRAVRVPHVQPRGSARAAVWQSRFYFSTSFTLLPGLH